MFDLFPKDEVVGFFRGFTENSGLEFHADLALPYQSRFNRVPMHGQFVLVQLEHEDEAILGRITSLSSEGRLTGAAGERFTMRAIREDRQIDERLREDYLTYKIDIRVLGVLRANQSELFFVPSQRRLPHVGSQVGFLTDALLREVAGHNLSGAEIGYLAFGEYIYAAGESGLSVEDWMQVKEPAVVVKFPIDSLLARRTFIFARAGFGKSNLNKLLFSALYAETPTVEKRGGRRVPVGTLLFDPDGEYFWPDDKGRPGFCDVPELIDKVVVFTSREAPSPYYQSFVAGDIRLDIRRLRPADVISIALSAEKQDQQNVRKLKGMNPNDWSELVDLIYDDGNSADLGEVRRLLRLEDGQDAEALAARANLTSIVRMLHDPSSQLMDMLLEALAAGKLCVVDVSKLRGGPSLVLSGLILRRIFDRNQEEFTKAEPQTIPTIAVIEEAQSVLSSNASGAEPYIDWVKEGRKYDLGAVLITQQPGSIPPEILSQGDNWFIFHLLSATDLQNLRRANAHFSDDLLSALLNEPIPGQGVFWSSVSGKPYPIPLRALSFESQHTRQDQDYDRPAEATFASALRARYACALAEAVAVEKPSTGIQAVAALPSAPTEVTSIASEASIVDGTVVERPVDTLSVYQQLAIECLRNDSNFKQQLATGMGIPWGAVIGILEKALPDSMQDRGNVAYNLVPRAVSEVLGGEQEKAWKTEARKAKSGKRVTWIVKC